MHYAADVNEDNISLAPRFAGREQL